MKDEFLGNIIVKFVGIRVKKSSYLIDGGSDNKKEKAQKMCHNLRLKIKKNCLEEAQLENKINYLEKKKLT